MSKLQLCITKPDFVLKTFMADNSKNVMRNRYASAVIIVLRGCVTFDFSPEAAAGIILENGAGITLENGAGITLESGAALFVSEGSDYNIYCHEAAESLIINFHTLPCEAAHSRCALFEAAPADDASFNIAPPDTDSSNTTPADVASFQPAPSAAALGTIDKHTALQLFEHLDLLLQHPDENHNEIFALYYRLLSLFPDAQRPSETAEALVEKAEKLIWEGYASSEISCNGIAKALNISEVYLRKLFLRYRKLPPSQYLLRVRMEKARQFLLEGCSVSDTAENTGYSDIYQFSRAYKKYHGIAPSRH